MEHYTLQSNESVLYRNNACRITNKNEKSDAELILTNLNLVFVKKTKKLFAKEEVSTEVYPIEEIKIYNDTPQIKQDYTEVEVFLVSGEKKVDLYSKSEVRKFINAAFELLTGKTMASRASDKVASSRQLVDNALGVDTLGAVKTVVEKGVIGTIWGGFGKKNPQKADINQVSEFVSVAKEIAQVKSTPKSDTDSFDSQIEKLKKLKDLLDAGIISQEEFDSKKRQIMEL